MHLPLSRKSYAASTLCLTNPRHSSWTGITARSKFEHRTRKVFTSAAVLGTAPSKQATSPSNERCSRGAGAACTFAVELMGTIDFSKDLLLPATNRADSHRIPLVRRGIVRV